MKIDFNKIQNVKHNEFDYEGQHWYLGFAHPLFQNCKKEGFSKWGLWGWYTNGVETIMIYKSDIKDHNKRAALFN